MCLVLILWSICSSEITAQSANAYDIELSNSDLNQFIVSNKITDTNKKLDFYRESMPKPITDAAVRKIILDRLPHFIKELEVDNPKANKEVKRLMNLVLSLYGREGVYDVILINHKTPMIMIDTGVVLVISTGTFLEMTSDDEFLGFIAHEIGHEYYLRYSIPTKNLRDLIETGGNEPFLVRKMIETLMLIELQCDLFAAVTLRHLQYNPLSFIECLERFSQKFARHPNSFHPSDKIRRKIVTDTIKLNKTERVKNKNQGLQSIRKALHQGHKLD